MTVPLFGAGDVADAEVPEHDILVDEGSVGCGPRRQPVTAAALVGVVPGGVAFSPVEGRASQGAPRVDSEPKPQRLGSGCDLGLDLHVFYP